MKLMRRRVAPKVALAWRLSYGVFYAVVCLAFAIQHVWLVSIVMILPIAFQAFFVTMIIRSMRQGRRVRR